MTVLKIASYLIPFNVICFLNKYNHTVNIKAFRNLPFPALISLLVTINITNIVEGQVTKVTEAIKVVEGGGRVTGVVGMPYAVDRIYQCCWGGGGYKHFRDTVGELKLELELQLIRLAEVCHLWEG